MRSWLYRLCVIRLGRVRGPAAYRAILRDHPDRYRRWLDMLEHQLSHDPVLEQLLASHCLQSVERTLGSFLGPSTDEPSTSLP
jgi:hypothetical protein